MATQFELVAEYRENLGKGASRRLRRAGKVPAVLYGGRREPRALMLDHARLLLQLGTEAFYSSILTLKVGDQSQPAVIKDLQRHPSRNAVLHVDFLRVLEDEKLRIRVPLHLLGESAAVGVKLQGGVLSRLETEVEVSCLPKHLPEYLEVDVSQLGIEENLHLSDIKAPEGVEIVELAHGRDLPIVAIHHPRAEEEELAPPAEEGVAVAEAAPEGAEAVEGAAEGEEKDSD